MKPIDEGTEIHQQLEEMKKIQREIKVAASLTVIFAGIAVFAVILAIIT